jgi:uracil-DNA glycosylase
VRPLLIGEAPGRSTPPGWPAFFGRDRSARVLWQLGFRVSRAADRPGNVDAMNLIDFYPGAKWPTEHARTCAHGLMHSLQARSRVVLVGRQVARAFGALESWDWFEWFWLHADHEERTGPRFAIMPHPSGLNRWWNDPRHMRQARTFVDKLLQPEVTP